MNGYLKVLTILGIIVVTPFVLQAIVFLLYAPGCWATTDDFEAVSFTALDNENNLYLLGKTTTIDFPFTINLTNTYSNDDSLFLMKYSPSGTLLWSLKYRLSEPDLPTSLQVDNNNNVIVSGTWMPNVSSFSSFFVSKFSPNGNLLFETKIGGQEFDENPRIVISKTNDIYLIGRISNYYPTGTKTNQQDHLELFRIDENGTIMFSKSIPIARIESIVIDSEDNIYFSSVESFGMYDPEKGTLPEHYLFLTKINSNGAVQFSNYINEIDILECSKLAIDNLNNIIITGVTQSGNYTLLNPTGSQISANDVDAFVEKIAPNGTKLWNALLPLTGSDVKIPLSITLAENNDITVKGRLKNSYEENITSIYSIQISSNGTTFKNLRTLELSPWGTWITNIQEQQDGMYFIIGTAHDPINILGNNLQIQGSRDVFVLQFNSINTFQRGMYIGGKGLPMNICY